MTTPSLSDATRRHFLRTALATAAATATGAVFADPAAAAGLGGLNAVREIDVSGLRPADHVVGGVLVQLDYDYLVFDAVEYDEFDRKVGSGKAVVRLDGCVARAFRTAGDRHLAAHPVDPARLANLDTYEVRNSTWVKHLQVTDPAARAAGRGLSHFVITFAETSFECVGTRLTAKLFQKDFGEVYDMLLDL